jgi:hypothetical protein
VDFHLSLQFRALKLLEIVLTVFQYNLHFQNNPPHCLDVSQKSLKTAATTQFCSSSSSNDPSKKKSKLGYSNNKFD